LTGSEDGRIAAAMDDILAYLRAHPRARDTADGIGRWWLSPAPYAPDSANAESPYVQAALDRLLVAGQVRAEPLPGGAVVYSGNDDNLGEHDGDGEIRDQRTGAGRAANFGPRKS